VAPLIGAVIGTALAVTVGRQGRRWVQRVRLSRMSDDGVTATAMVVWVDTRRDQGRLPGSTVCMVYFAWFDPGGEQLRERRYRFFAQGLRAFEVLVSPGTRVPVRYPRCRPDRFIADIPYAPTMADQFI
jgi:uncharacterized protein DUF3592